MKRKVEGCDTISDREGGDMLCDPLSDRSSRTYDEMFVNN